jgi:sensor domain CHASE-containing protein
MTEILITILILVLIIIGVYFRNKHKEDKEIQKIINQSRMNADIKLNNFVNLFVLEFLKLARNKKKDPYR